MEYLDVDWKTDQFADLLFGDYLNREDKVGAFSHVMIIGGDFLRFLNFFVFFP